MKKFFIQLLVSALVLAIAALPGALAQNAKGAISGHVTDSSGSVLQGAEIEVQPGRITTASGTQGAYFINDLNPGTYTVSVTYVGLALFTKVVNVASGQTTILDAKLEVSSQRDIVLVTIERASGEAEAINRQRTADNIVQVLPNDVITSLPNANMADAIGRLPSVTLERDEGEGKYVQVRGTEPRLTNATLDGVNVPSPESGIRQLKFDTIPADLVESVEINKTLQANMDGDGIGGSVNLVTKTAGERPTIAVNGMGGYTPIIGGRGVVETSATIGQRFGSQKKFGALIGGSYDWNGRGIDDIEPIPDQATNLPGSPRYFDQMDVREYRYYRSRWGLAGSLDYKLSEGSSIYVRGLYSDFKNFGDRWAYTICDNTPNVTLLGADPNVGNTCTTPSFNTQIRRPDYAISNLVVGGKHVLTSTWYSWDISASRSRQIENGDPSASFGSTLDSSQCMFDPAATNGANKFRPQWTPACFTEAYNQGNMALSEIDTASGETAQVNLQFAGAMGKIYHVGSHLATLEFGGRFRNAHKFDDSLQFADAVNDGVSILSSDFPSRFSNSNYYNKSYQLGPNPLYGDVRNFYLANTGDFTRSIDPSAQFDLIEKVGAGYIMNTIDFNKVRIVAGVRIEGTKLDTDSFDSNSGAVTDKHSGSYVNVLPSISVRVPVMNDTYLRFSYARGLSRPDPQDIAQSVSYSTSAPFQAQVSNPGLKAERADNFDILLEHYLKPFGMLQAGFYYKNLYDPIVETTRRIPNFVPAPGVPPQTYDVSQFVNAGSGWVYGFEVAYVQHWTFLPGLLRGFGLGANYGYANSRAVDLPGRSDSPRLLRSAPNTWNISPTYDLGRVSFRAGLSYNDANIFSYKYQDGSALGSDGTSFSTPTPGGIKGPLSDIYFYPHLQIDLQGSVRLSHGLTFVAYVLNANNEVFGFYQGSSQYMIQREYYQPTYAAGFRWSPGFEHK